MPISRLIFPILVVAAVLTGCGGAPSAATTPTSPAGATVIVPTTAPAPTAAPTSKSVPTAGLVAWSLVAVGDSIPFNSPDDCPGCTGFVDRYAAAITKLTGHPVKVTNLSQHNGLQIDGLLDELKTDAKRRDALATADIIVVSIGHNDTAWNRGDDPCDGQNGDNPDWSKYNATCATAAAEIFRPKFERVFSQIVALRTGKPTIFRTINVYNDWIGEDGVPSAATNATNDFINAWDAMTCKAATSNGFACADIYHAFNGSDGRTPALDLLGKDYTHPSDKGNEVIARVLADLGFELTTISPTVTVLPAATTPAPTSDSQHLAVELDTMFQDLTTANQFSGSVLIAKDGQVILSKGYGFADRQQHIPNTPQTVFRIGHITKAFTAMAILLLQEQGKLSVQDTMCMYITGCPEAWKAITIHQLLTQTSGIPDTSDAFNEQDITSSAPRDHMFADAKTNHTVLDSLPGKTYNNNNMGYLWLGKIIEAVSGQSYEAYLQKNVFAPLQMSNTGNDHKRADLAIGYADRQPIAIGLNNMWVMSSAAGLYSTVEDLYRWEQALSTDRLMPQKARDTMFTSYVESEREGYGYGYGWYVSPDKPRIVKQPGQINGFNATIRRYLDDKLTIILLTNQEDSDNGAFANAIAEKLLGK